MRRIRTTALAVLIAVLLPLGLQAQEGEGTDDPWAPLRGLVGAWIGSDRTSDSVTQVTHIYGFVFGGEFLKSQTRAVLAPAGDATNPTLHETVGYFSHDSERGKIIFRQFASDGVVSTHVLQDFGPGVLVFASEAVEDGGGLRERVTFRFRGRDTFDLAVDRAAPGGDYRTQQRLVLRRVTEAGR